MFDPLYRCLRTPLGRALAVFFLCLLILLLFRFSAGSVWQARLLALIPAAMAVNLLMRFRGRWRTAKYGLARWEIRMVRSWGAYSRKPVIVDALHLLGIAMLFTSVAGLVAGLYSDARIGMVPTFAVFAVAGVCEITVQAKRMFKQAWAKTAGKILSLSLGVMLTAVTVSMAKQTVHSLAHVDPKYMAEFTAVVAAGLLPLVYLGAAGVLLLLWAALQVLLLVVILFGSSLLTQTRPLMGDGAQNRVRLFWYRIRTGKRPPDGVLPASGFMPQHEVSLIGSVVSKLVVGLALAQMGEGLAIAVPGATPWMEHAMVSLEYRPASSCRNIDARFGVVYLDGGKVSVARFYGGSYRFSVEKCEYGEGT
jgi:hypothetical protein